MALPSSKTLPPLKLPSRPIPGPSSASARLGDASSPSSTATADHPALSSSSSSRSFRHSSAPSIPAPIRPNIDRARADSLLSLTEDQLSLLPRDKLVSTKRDIERFVSQASELLTVLLEEKDGLESDSKAYNGMIQVASLCLSFSPRPHSLTMFLGPGIHRAENKVALERSCSVSFHLGVYQDRRLALTRKKREHVRAQRGKMMFHL
jgi:hypothetical protein